MVTVGAFKTSELDTPQPMAFPCLALRRLTADCIFKGLQLQKVFFNNILPTLPTARWIIIVLIADDASSNRRVMAWIMQLCSKARRRVLVLCIKCIAHLLHRCSVPVVKTLGLCTPLYRAANCLSYSGYWSGLLRSLESHVYRNIRIYHHTAPDPSNAVIVEQILRLTCPLILT